MNGSVASPPCGDIFEPIIKFLKCSYQTPGGLLAAARGDRIVAAAAPGVTPPYPLGGEPEAAAEAVHPDCLEGILAAGGGVAARRREERGDAELVETDGADGQI